MKKLSKEKQQQIIAVALGALMVIAALWFLVISNQKTKLAKLDADIASQTQTLNTALRAISMEAAKLKALAERTNQLAQLQQTFMPTNDVYSTFRTTLNRFKVPFQNTVEIIDVSKERVAPLGMFVEFPYATAIFSVRGTAHYHNFGRFIAELENSFAFYRVGQINLSAGGLDAGERTEKLLFEMDIITLIRPQTP